MGKVLHLLIPRSLISEELAMKKLNNKLLRSWAMMSIAEHSLNTRHRAWYSL